MRLIIALTILLNAIIVNAQYENLSLTKNSLIGVITNNYNGDTLEDTYHEKWDFAYYENEKMQEECKNSMHYNPPIKTITRYNKDGHISEQLYGNLDTTNHSEWTNYNHNIYNYNQNAKLLTKHGYSKTLNPPNSTLEYVKSCHYKEDNSTVNYIREYYYVSDTINHVFEDRYYYEDNQKTKYDRFSLLVTNQNPLTFDTMKIDTYIFYSQENYDSVIHYTKEANEAKKIANINVTKADDNDTITRYYNCHNDNIILKSERKLAYSNFGKLILNHLKYYNSSIFIEESFQIFDYDEHQNIISYERIELKNENEDISKYQKKEFERDENGKILLYKNIWKNSLGELKTIETYEYLYNDEYNLECLIRRVNMPNQPLAIYRKHEFHYNTELIDNTVTPKNYRSFLLDFNYYNESLNTIDYVITYQNIDGELKKQRKTQFFYEENLFNPTSIQSNETVNCTVYPNPSDGIFTISLEENSSSEIEIFNQTGSLCLSKQFCKETQVDLSHLSNGIYYSKIISEDGKITTGKLVLQK